MSLSIKSLSTSRLWLCKGNLPVPMTSNCLSPNQLGLELWCFGELFILLMRSCRNCLLWDFTWPTPHIVHTEHTSTQDRCILTQCALKHHFWLSAWYTLNIVHCPFVSIMFLNQNFSPYWRYESGAGAYPVCKLCIADSCRGWVAVHKHMAWVAQGVMKLVHRLLVLGYWLQVAEMPLFTFVLRFLCDILNLKIW